MKDNFKLGPILMEHFNNDCNLVYISQLANRLKLEHLNELNEFQMDILHSLARMADDPQFEFTVEELKCMGRDLILREEFEELGLPIPEIKNCAEDIGKGWLYCPICHEAWENESTYGMVECPGCKNKLHNPKYKML